MNCIINAWAQHEAELRGFLTQKAANPAQAEDILQETFLRAVSEGRKFCSLENPRAWLFRVARNQLIDHSRRAETKLASTELAADIADKFDEIPVVQTLDICLPKALTQLNEEDRSIIEHCDLDGLSQADFAAKNRLTLVATKSRIQRARKRLKSELVELCKVNYDEAGNVCCFSAKGSQC